MTIDARPKQRWPPTNALGLPPGGGSYGWSRHMKYHNRDRDRRRKRRNRCVTGKSRYRDHDEATHNLHAIRNYSDRDVMPQRVYRCGFCKGWHLTSQE